MNGCNKDNNKEIIHSENNSLNFNTDEYLQFIVKKMNLQKLDQSQITARGDDDCMDISSKPCFGPYTKTYEIDYEGCVFQITGEIYVCIDEETGKTYFTTGEFDINTQDWWTDRDCLALINKWMDLWLNGKREELNDAIDTWQYELEVSWEQAFVNEYILHATSKSYFCDQSELDANVIVDNFKGTCYQRCFNYTEDGELIWQDIRCGYGCCKRTTEYCVDRKTGELQQSTTLEVLEECNYDPEPYPGCDYLSICTENCSKIR